MSVEILLLIIILLFSITFHEYAHGLMAYKLGDNTPKISGRLTINPIKHIDILGTIVMPILLIITTRGLLAFGYAKPVPINPYNFKNPRKDIMWVGLAGPASNFLIALIMSIILRMDLLGGIIEEALQYGVVINLILFIFNLIPIPPLDGSRVVSAFLSYNNAYRYLKLETVGFIIIILLIINGMFEWFLRPALRILLNIMGLNNIII